MSGLAAASCSALKDPTNTQSGAPRSGRGAGACCKVAQEILGGSKQPPIPWLHPEGVQQIFQEHSFHVMCLPRMLCPPMMDGDAYMLDYAVADASMQMQCMWNNHGVTLTKTPAYLLSLMRIWCTLPFCRPAVDDYSLSIPIECLAADCRACRNARPALFPSSPVKPGN